MRIDPKVFRCWVGNHATPDAVVRSVIRHQCTDTGADLFSQALSDEILAAYNAGASGTTLARLAVPKLTPQLHREGWLAPPVRDADTIERAGWWQSFEPWYDAPFFKQGMQAAGAIIYAAAGYPRIAGQLARFIDASRMPDTDLRVAHLWPAGPAGPKWTGGWTWATDVIPLEDATQVAQVATMHAFALPTSGSANSLAEIARINEYLVPYCASRRSGLPDWGRAIAPAAYSTEETARVGMLLEALRLHPETTTRIRARLKAMEIVDANGKRTGTWPRFVDAWGITVYPAADPTDPTRRRPPRMGELTRDRSRAVVAGGYDTTTVTPAMLVDVPATAA